MGYPNISILRRKWRILWAHFAKISTFRGKGRFWEPFNKSFLAYIYENISISRKRIFNINIFMVYLNISILRAKWCIFQIILRCFVDLFFWCINYCLPLYKYWIIWLQMFKSKYFKLEQTCSIRTQQSKRLFSSNVLLTLYLPYEILIVPCLPLIVIWTIAALWNRIYFEILFNTNLNTISRMHKNFWLPWKRFYVFCMHNQFLNCHYLIVVWNI